MGNVYLHEVAVLEFSGKNFIFPMNFHAEKKVVIGLLKLLAYHCYLIMITCSLYKISLLAYNRLEIRVYTETTGQEYERFYIL